MNNIARDRRSPRFSIEADVLIRNGEGARIKAHMFNICEHGCGLYSPSASIKAGAIYSVKVHGLEAIAGRVKWTRAEWSGFEFSHPLYPAVVEHLANRRAYPFIQEEAPSWEGAEVALLRKPRLFDPPAH